MAPSFTRQMQGMQGIPTGTTRAVGTGAAGTGAARAARAARPASLQGAQSSPPVFGVFGTHTLSPGGPRRTLARATNAEAKGDDAFGIGKFLKSVQGALPVVGLVSRLTAPEGGVGNDECAYPEYCRQVYEASPEGFQEAVGDLQNKYGKSAQRKYVLLCLWMVKQGSGLVRDSLVVDSARRVRVSQDVEFEMERFLNEYEEGMGKYEYIKDRPTRALEEQAEVAVDAMARLILPIQDGDAIAAEDCGLIEDLVTGGMLGYPAEWRACVHAAIETRGERGERYAKAKR
jgi:hypothetical protein